MKYDITIDMFSHLSVPMIEHMLTNVVEEQTGKKIVKLEPKYIEDKFSGYDVTFVSEKDKEIIHTPKIIDKSFKQLVYK